MLKYRVLAVIFILVGLAVGAFDVLHIKYPDSYFAKQFKLGLDLKGGAHLVYKADVSAIKSEEVGNAMEGLRDVIERRVNMFGVGEPVVQVEESGFLKNAAAKEQRLIVELPGVTDLDQAIKMLGETPFLEFKTENPNVDKTATTTTVFDAFVSTQLTGRYLKKAAVEFNGTTYEPAVSLEFNEEGAKLFQQLTKENVGKTIAIFLDGLPISIPRVNEEIPSGKAQISGKFTPQEAKQLVQRLNSGALPVPISLVSQQTVGPTLGVKVLNQGVQAGIYGLIFVAIFLVLWYRLPGLIAVLALLVYAALTLAIFKLFNITITAAGIAGFILSIGMAVDANILIFERMKEERRLGKSLTAAVSEGFDRAWLSIRDSNVSSLISSLILFWMGTSMVKGFAVTLGLGVIVSMFTAITVSRTFLLAIGVKGEGRISRFLFAS